jgi:hypothetical protein
LEVVLQVFADPGTIEHDGNAVFAQLRRRPDAGQQQQMGRADGAGREDDLAATAGAPCPAPLTPSPRPRAAPRRLSR